MFKDCLNNGNRAINDNGMCTVYKTIEENTERETEIETTVCIR